MKRLFAGLTDPGLVRSVNQDAYYIHTGGQFFIVADGMGGHAGGQEASRIAIETIKSYLVEHWESDQSSQDLLEGAFIKANQAILQDQKSHPERSDMGTTAVVVIFRDNNDNHPWCAHVGDSRFYRMRGANLQQMTDDHTWVSRAIKLGDISAEEAKVHPYRHVLSQCLGREDLSQIDIQSVEVQPGDRLLLCSDGLTEELQDSSISSILKSIRVCEKASAALVNSAKDKGGRDNITVIVIAIYGLSSASE